MRYDTHFWIYDYYYRVSLKYLLYIYTNVKKLKCNIQYLKYGENNFKINSSIFI